MNHLEPQTLGSILVILAGALTGVLLLALRNSPRGKKPPPGNMRLAPVGIPTAQDTDEAIILVQVGGRVAYINAVARRWFALNGKEPNLERLVSRASPVDDFMGLCSAEGRARFSLDSRFVEGSSSYIPLPDDAGGYFLISLRRLQAAEILPGVNKDTIQAVDIFSNLNQSISSSLELAPTLTAILESARRLIPADIIQVAIWDEANQHLVPYRLVGYKASERQLEKGAERYQAGQGYAGQIVSTRQPLLIMDVDDYPQKHPGIEPMQAPIKSYLGVPLMIQNEFVGTLELASLEKDGFTQDDQILVNVYASQAAIALQHTLLFERTEQKLRELSGLAKLTQTTGGRQNLTEFFSHLMSGISPLVQVESIGFLIYDEARRRLAAQAPFIGIPTEFVDVYQVTIAPGSEGEAIWLSQQMIVAYPAADDSRMIALGISGLFQAAGLTNIALLPLISGEKMIGYLQVADKLDGQLINQGDLRILTNISIHAATVIENLLLVKQSQERALRSETMRRIASLTGSVATVDEILAFSLRELARLLRVDVAAILLTDESRAELRVHSGSLYGIEPDVAARVSRISMNDPEYLGTVTGSQRQIFSDDVRKDTLLASLYRLMADVLGMNSLIGVPVIVREHGIGEVILASRKTEFFDPSDLILLNTTASQIASAIEKSSLYTQTDESLQRRVEQLTSLTRISRELNTNLDLRSLLELVHAELKRTTRASCGYIALYAQKEDAMGERVAFIRVGDGGEDIPSALEAKVLAYEEPIVVPDYGQPILALGSTRIAPPHPGVVSSLIVPISYQEGIAGLVHLHSAEVDHFDKTTQEITQTLATQAAIALGNASRFFEQRQQNELLSRRVETIEKLMEAGHSLSPAQALDVSLEAIAYGVEEATPFTQILIGLHQPLSGSLDWITGAGYPLEVIEGYRASPVPWEDIDRQLSGEYRFGQVFFIPEEGTSYEPDISLVAAAIPAENTTSRQAARWNMGDTLLALLEDSQGQAIGLIRAEQPRDGKRPDRLTLQTLEIFAIQASLVVESHQRLQTMDQALKSVQAELAEAAAALAISRSTQPVLQSTEVESSVATRPVSPWSRRIQVALGIHELISSLSNDSDVIEVFSREALKWAGMSQALVVEIRDGNIRLSKVIGTPAAPSINLDVLLGQRNPIQFILQSKSVLAVPDLDENAEWKHTPLLHALEAKSFICVPILAAEEAVAILLMVSTNSMPFFSKEDENLLEMLCRQAAMALQNIHLSTELDKRLQEFNHLLEFSRQLGALDPLSILRSLVDSALKAIPHAGAGVAALWQAEEQQLVPQVAIGYSDNEKILQIKFSAGQSLPGKAYTRGEAICVGEVNFAQDYNLPQEYLLLYRDATGGRLPISSLVMPIRTGVNTYGVLVLDNFREAAIFTKDDQNIAASLTRQTALTLERTELYQAVEQRAAQLQALTNVAGTITSSLRTDEVINLLLSQARSIIPFATGTLWLRRGDDMVVRSAYGFEDSDQRTGLVVAVEDSLLLREMIETVRPILVGDVRLDARFPQLMEPRYLTWLGIPLISKGQLVGVIALEKEEPNFYADENVKVMITFAGQAAVALENARLYEESTKRAVELDERSQRLSLLNRFSEKLSGSLDLAYILQLTLDELARAVPYDLVSAVLFDAEGRAVLQREHPPVLDAYPSLLPESPIFDRLHETLGIYSTDDIQGERDLDELRGFFELRSARGLLILPLVTGDELLGLFLAHTHTPGRFELDDVELARTISNQASVAIQNARLFQETERLFSETQQRSTELGVLFDLGVNLTQVLDQNRLIEATFENVTRLIGGDTCGLVLMTQAGDILELHAVDRGEKIGPLSIHRSGNSFSEYVLTTSEPLFIRDIEHEQDLLPVQGYTLGEPVKSWIGVPLSVRGVTSGVLSVQSYQPNAFNESQLRLLGQVGNQLAVALDNARLFENTQVYADDMAKRVSERTRELEIEHNRSQTLLRIITELSASLDQDLVLSRTLAILNETIGSEYSMILLVDPEKNSLYLRSWLAEPSMKPKGKHPGGWKVGEPLASWVVANGKAAVITNLEEDNRWPAGARERNGYHSAIAVPLLMGEECLGALILFHRQKHRFTLDTLELAQGAAKQIAVSINNTQLFNLIRDQAERLGELLRSQHVETSRSQAMLEAVADGVLVTDAHRVITLFNASAEKILGLDRKQILGQSLENFLGLFGKAAQEWAQTIDAWSDNPVSRKPGESKSAQIELEDERVVSVHLSPVLLRNDFLGTVSIFQDITHRVELDRLKSEFVATVSHELRTPMTSIKGYVEILLMGAAGSLNEAQTRFLQVVRSNTDRLATLVNDLLDISRIEAGRVVLSWQPLEPQYLIRSAADLISRRSSDEHRPMTVSVEIEDAIPPAFGDRERVQQILDNLVQNAYQYTPEAGEILIRAQVVEDMLQFSVKDNGIGVPVEDHPRIFERFFRGEDPLVLATSGTGLGLSIVKHLVEMHGGRIWFESSGIPGLGSTFSFTIPLFTTGDSNHQMPLQQRDTGRRV